MVHANQSQNVGLNGQSKRPSTQVQNRSGRVHGNSDISQKAKGDNSVFDNNSQTRKRIVKSGVQSSSQGN